MLVIFPALFRVFTDGDTKRRILVVKANILVKLDEPMVNKSKGMGMMAMGLLMPTWQGNRTSGGGSGDSGDSDDARKANTNGTRVRRGDNGEGAEENEANIDA